MATLPVGRVILREQNRLGNNNLAFPEDIGPHGMLFVFRKYNFSSARGGGFPSLTERVVGDTVFLPLPVSLQDNLAINVEAGSVGLFGESVSRVAESTAEAEDVGGIASAITNVITSNIPRGGDVAAGIVGMVQQLMGSSSNQTAVQNLTSQLKFLLRRNIENIMPGTSRAIDAGLGTTTNPKAALMFDGVVLKNFSFTWNLAPKSRGESERLKNIVEVIRKNSLPSYLSLGFSREGSADFLARALLQYPSMVDIFLIGVDPSHYIKFKTAMIRGVAVNYTPQQGHMILAGGKPGAISLDLQLIEADIHTAEDYGSENETQFFGEGG